MAGGVKETDPERLAESCENFMKGTKRLYDGDGRFGSTMKGDMWLFELFHHLNDCAAALRAERDAPAR